MGAKTIFGYDLKDNFTRADSPTGAFETSAFNGATHPFYPSGRTNAHGRSMALAYDPPGNLKTAQNDLPADNRASATYNLNGTVATTTDPMGNTAGASPVFAPARPERLSAPQALG